MADTLGYLFGAGSFLPQGVCLLWRADLMALHAVADGLSGAAHLAIPCAILLFWYRRPHMANSCLAGLLVLFTLSGGLAQLADLATLWWPAYRTEGLLKTTSALLSIATAISVWLLLPNALALPSPVLLQRRNAALAAEVDRRILAQSELAMVRDGLERRVEERTAELARANTQLEAEVVERRRAEALARASEAQLRRTADSLRLAVKATSLGIWDVDVVAGTRQWSDELKAILGLPASAAADLDLLAALIHPDDREWVMERFRHAFEPAGGGSYSAEFRILRADDGAERWLSDNGRVYFDSTGRPTRAAGTMADITERRRAVEALEEGEERYRALVETAPQAVFVHRQGTIVLVNREAVTLFGARDATDLLGRQSFALVDRASLELARTRTAALTVPGARAEFAELTFRRLDGSAFTVEAAAVAVPIDGQLMIQVVFCDISARKRAAAILEARTAELETVMETVPVAVWLAHDPQARRITGNRHAYNLLRLPNPDNPSFSADDAHRPTHFRILKDGREVLPEQLPLQRAARGEVVRNEELRVVFDDGTYFDELLSATPVRDAAGNVTGAVGASIDISDRKAAEELVRHTALHDPLTDLPNRLLFYDRLAHALARARRSDGQLAVMLLDLDQFKEVNDSLGHSAGDTLLREVAARLRGLTRASDTWARLGGDEFALVQEGITDPGAAGRMAGRVLAALDSPFLIDEQEIEISASIGFTTYPAGGADAEQLVRNADVALYRAKSTGRSRFERYGPAMDHELVRHRKLQRGLRRAMTEGELELLYQPVFELPRLRLAKAEALLRWNQPGGTSMPPADFIPIAEASGLIHDLGQWVLNAACHQATIWRDAGRPLKVAVNVSAAQLRRPDFAAMVLATLERTRLQAGLLELELTESVFLDASKEQIHDTLRRLAEHGVTLVIDDFGIGYSSLAHLVDFPFDEVKIDGSFLVDIGRSTDGGMIAAAIVSLAHNLGKRVTAEGVENAAQLEFLRAQGCDAAQGYLLGHPGPVADIIHLKAVAA